MNSTPQQTLASMPSEEPCMKDSMDVAKLLGYRATCLRHLERVLCMTLSAMDQGQAMSLTSTYSDGQLSLCFKVLPSVNLLPTPDSGTETSETGFSPD